MLATELNLDRSPNPMPSLNHSYICLQILRQLLLQNELEPLPELTLDIGKGLTPDISVFRKEAIQPNFLRDVPRYSQMPILAIEVISASQNIQELLEKALQLIEAGVKAVWTIEPYGRTIFVTTSSGETLFHNELVESEGIQVDFAQVFRSPLQ
jgi:Uma2 family endonuclease